MFDLMGAFKAISLLLEGQKLCAEWFFSLGLGFTSSVESGSVREITRTAEPENVT
jgi:hypothetical protein